MPSCIARLSRELNRKRLSQPDPDRVSLTAAWPDQPAGAYIGRMRMTREVQREPESMISRRTLVNGLAIAAGATVAGASGALAQQGGQLGPPTTITSPPRDFGPGRAPPTHFLDPANHA